MNEKGDIEVSDANWQARTEQVCQVFLVFLVLLSQGENAWLHDVHLLQDETHAGTSSRARRM